MSSKGTERKTVKDQERSSENDKDSCNETEKRHLSPAEEWRRDPWFPARLRIVVPLALYSVVFLVVALITLVSVWPANPSQVTNSTLISSTRLFGYSFSISDEVRILLITITVGAVGSFVHSLTSLTSYVGNKKFVASWAMWYVLRPFIGSGLALIIYFAFRGGLMNPGSGIKDINLFGIAALSGLAGMFSREASDKLGEVFATIFKSDSNKERKDKLTPTQGNIDSQEQEKQDPPQKP